MKFLPKLNFPANRLTFIAAKVSKKPHLTSWNIFREVKNKGAGGALTVWGQPLIVVEAAWQVGEEDEVWLWDATLEEGALQVQLLLAPILGRTALATVTLSTGFPAK